MAALIDKFIDQAILIDKPLQWTSFDIVKKVRNSLRIKKVGHAGTLDPLASGLLILCTGKATKTIDNIQGQIKEYTGTICLGSITPSYDLETEPEQFKDYAHITIEHIRKAAEQLTGTIKQIPPIYSAIKQDGKRAYESARSGEAIVMKERTVSVEVFEITNLELPNVNFRIVCSKGTYIRSIAHDLGQLLGVGGHLTALCRTKIGEYSLADAWQIDDLISSIKEAQNQES